MTRTTKRSAAEFLLLAVTAGTLIGYGAVTVVLAAFERVRYGRRRCEVSVYPGVLRVYAPSKRVSLHENRTTS